jgi:hypothetical protein
MERSGLGSTEEVFLTEILHSPCINIEVADAVAADVAAAVGVSPPIFIAMVPISIPGFTGRFQPGAG